MIWLWYGSSQNIWLPFFLNFFIYFFLYTLIINCSLNKSFFSTFLTIEKQCKILSVFLYFLLWCSYFLDKKFLFWFSSFCNCLIFTRSNFFNYRFFSVTLIFDFLFYKTNCGLATVKSSSWFSCDFKPSQNFCPLFLLYVSILFFYVIWAVY